MIIPLPLKCVECQQEYRVTIKLIDQDIKWECQNCGYLNDGFLGQTVTIGTKLLFRSYYECHKTEDYNLSIVFSAMAVDCELSRLFKKNKEIEELKDKKLPDEVEIEIQLRQIKNVKEKFKEVIALYYPEGIEKYFSKYPNIKQSLKKFIPAFSPSNFYKHVEEELFWKRNKILHDGVTSYSKTEAVQCYAIAKILLEMLNRMDWKKYIEQDKKSC